MGSWVVKPPMLVANFIFFIFFHVNAISCEFSSFFLSLIQNNFIFTQTPTYVRGKGGFLCDIEPHSLLDVVVLETRS